MELYVRPEFFEKLGNFMPFDYSLNIDEGNSDIYTEIRKHTSKSIISKFKEIRYIPLSGGNIDYEDDKWDFSQYTMVKYSHSVLVFSTCSDLFKDDLKDFILLMILNGNIKISSVYSAFTNIRFFLNYLAKSGLYSIEGIDDSDIEKFFNSIKVSERTFIKYQTNIKKFLQYYDTEHDTEVYTPGIAQLCQRIEFNKLKALIIEKRRKAIPEEYFNKLLSKLIHIMNDNNETSFHRGMAAMLVIDSQTGLRASELSLLEANSIKEIDIDGEKARMINYKIIKTAKGNTGYTEEITYINDISFEAYKVALEVFSENRIERKTNLLCCPKRAALPVRPDSYIAFLKKICVLNYKELNSTDTKLKETLDGIITKQKYITHFENNKATRCKQISHFSNEQEFYYPIVHQFRNTVVTGLLNRGIQLEFIRRYMGHLTEEMTSAYAESYDTKMQENLSVSETALSTIINGDAKLLGPNAEKLTNSIDKWIEQNKLNVSANFDEIIQRLEKLIPIRAKRGGYCIKGSKITNACSVDVQTDEFMCAVGLCPNICHFYFNADESYEDYKETMTTYKFNKDNGFLKQANKEYSKARFIMMNRLAPEIFELDKEINKVGIQKILDMHPELKNVLNNLEDIKEEINGYTKEKLK